MLLENRAKKIAVLEKYLKQIPKISNGRYPGSYIHTNDAGMEETLKQIQGLRVNTNKLKLGLIVGTGAVLSVLPELDVEGVVVIDKNSYITEWIQYAASQLSLAGGFVDYENQVYGFSNPLAEELRREYKDTRLSLPGSELRSLGRFHVLSGFNDRFTLCQRAVESKKIMTANMSLCNTEQVTALREAIERSDGEIIYANLTNIWHWEGGILRKYLSQLPFHPEAIIQFSTCSTKVLTRGSARFLETDLWSGYCRGLENYFVLAAKDLLE